MGFKKSVYKNTLLCYTLNMQEENIVFVDYSPRFKSELNAWSDAEQARGLRGFQDFVATKGVKLGDYIDYFATETDIIAKLAICKADLVGFVLYSLDASKAHIEIAGTNPNFRGKGYANRIMLKLRDDLHSLGVTKIEFEVDKRNLVALKTFGKIAKPSTTQSLSNYTGMEL